MRGTFKMDGDTVKAYIFMNVCAFVMCLLGGIFFWAGYSFGNAVIFALITTFISLIFSAPGVFTLDTHKKVSEVYITFGGIVGGVLVLVMLVVGLFGRLFSGGPEQEVISPQNAAIIVGAISVVAGILFVVWDFVESAIRKR